MISLAEKTVDLMVAVHNRMDFTRECLSCLFNNTNWRHVKKLFVYDVDSTDGSGQLIRDMLCEISRKVDSQVVGLSKINCTAVLNHHIKNTTAPIVGKIDNDTLVPPGWLDAALSTLARHGDVQILGLEAMMPLPTTNVDPDAYGITEAAAVGGLFLGRRSAFATLPFIYGRYEDLWKWQKANPEVQKAWINPSIPLVLLDRLPFEPWSSLSRMYIEKGWQRPSEPYPKGHPLWAWRWPSVKGSDRSKFSVAQVSGLKVDLGSSDRPPEGYDVYVDIAPHPSLPKDKVRVADLTKTWPFQDGEVSHFRAYDIVEHLPDKIHTMNEMYRCLANGGTAEIFVPIFDGAAAVSDPQHISFWNRLGFEYFTKGSFAHQRFAKTYGIEASFEVLGEEKKLVSHFYPSGEEVVKHLKIMLCARKKSVQQWSIVIPSNSSSGLRRTLRALFAAHPELDPSWVIVIDDGARANWTASDPSVTWIQGKKPFNYSRALNVGFQASPPGVDVFVTADDCEPMTPGLVSILRKVSLDRPNTGMVSPGISGPVGNPQQIYKDGGEVIECSPVGLAFVSVYITRGLIQNIGLMDERFTGYGCDDKDYCERAKRAGFGIYIHTGTEVIHNAPGMPSVYRTSSDINSRHMYNKKLYEEKWGTKL